jgi:hypothetical protein
MMSPIGASRKIVAKRSQVSSSNFKELHFLEVHILSAVPVSAQMRWGLPAAAVESAAQGDYGRPTPILSGR